MNEYKINFALEGLQTEIFQPSWLTSFPPLTLLKIQKV